MSWNRREFLKIVGRSALPLLSANSLLYPLLTKRQSPNILFIAVDDLRPQLNCYGHQQMISPNIDRLAAQGMIFHRTYCQVPVCGASRASLLMGRRPTRSRFLDYSTRADVDCPDVQSLPGYLKANGYHTISNGKVFHHKNDNSSSWSESSWRPQGEWAKRGYLSYDNKKYVLENKGAYGPAFENADVSDNAYSDGKLTDKSITDLRKLKAANQPFFLGVGYLKPHLPFTAPKRFWDLYRRENINLADNPFRPEGAPNAALHNWGELRKYAGIPKHGPLSEDLARTLVHGYYACVSSTDFQIGRLLNELDQLGLADNTVVILWGDHGWNLGEHGLWCKHCNFETSLHSPMIISTPWHKGGQKTEALTEFVDIYPSLVEICGLPRPDNLEGKSFMPLLENPDHKWKKAVFSRYKEGDSIKTDRYRYTEWTNDDGDIYARMLYDHHLDLAENINIADLRENQALVAKLQTMLQAGYRGLPD